LALKLITAPATEPLTLAEAKAHLRVTHTASDGLITNLIKAAREYCEGFQNRQYITAAWELWLDAWPDKNCIYIPRPPLQSVASVKYYSPDNTEYSMDPADYFVDEKSEPGRLAFAYGKSWPAATLRPAGGIVICFSAGYGDAKDVPQKVKQAMLLKVELDFDRHEPAESENLLKAVQRLLWLDRVVNL